MTARFGSDLEFLKEASQSIRAATDDLKADNDAAEVCEVCTLEKPLESYAGKELCRECKWNAQEEDSRILAEDRDAQKDSFYRRMGWR